MAALRDDECGYRHAKRSTEGTVDRNGVRIEKYRGFSLLSAYSFPVMGNSFPVIFYREMR